MYLYGLTLNMIHLESIFEADRSKAAVVTLKTTRTGKFMTNKQFPKMPEPRQFCLETGLYERFKLDAKNIRSLEKFNSTLDIYCVECQRESIFEFQFRYTPDEYGDNVATNDTSPILGIPETPRPNSITNSIHPSNKFKSKNVLTKRY